MTRSLSGLRRHELVDRMHEQRDELNTARDQTERLLRAIIDLGSELDLGATLQRIVTAATDLTGAPYGAIGVRGQDGRIVKFVHSGISAEIQRMIGRTPVGKGLLGIPLNDEQVVRIADLTEHSATVGFPEHHHPRMRAFLGLPIMVRGDVFGSLYLADDDPVRAFSDTDEMMVLGLCVGCGHGYRQRTAVRAGYRRCGMDEGQPRNHHRVVVGSRGGHLAAATDRRTSLRVDGRRTGDRAGAFGPGTPRWRPTSSPYPQRRVRTQIWLWGNRFQ